TSPQIYHACGNHISDDAKEKHAKADKHILPCFVLQELAVAQKNGIEAIEHSYRQKRKNQYGYQVFSYPADVLRVNGQLVFRRMECLYHLSYFACNHYMHVGAAAFGGAGIHYLVNNQSSFGRCKGVVNQHPAHAIALLSFGSGG